MIVRKRYETNLIASVIALLLILANSDLAAQDTQKANTVTLCCSLTTPVNCEDVMLYLDMAALEARKDQGGSIIIIGRLGDKEKSQKLNRTRVISAKDYLGRRVENQIITAFGEPVKGYGRIEVYISGKLLYVLPYPRRAMIDCSF